LLRIRGGRARDWSTALVSTVGDTCRVVLRDTLARTIRWIVEKVRKHARSSEKVFAALVLGERVLEIGHLALHMPNLQNSSCHVFADPYLLTQPMPCVSYSCNN
jgi:hypothetical protein